LRKKQNTQSGEVQFQINYGSPQAANRVQAWSSSHPPGGTGKTSTGLEDSEGSPLLAHEKDSGKTGRIPIWRCGTGTKMPESDPCGCSRGIEVWKEVRSLIH